MSELNMVLRQHALNGLQTQLDAAVQNGDQEAARKVAADMATLQASTAPKGNAYGDAEIIAELNKQAWFGVDPKRTAKAKEFGKTLDPAKFATPAAFAEALVRAVDEEFKPATVTAPKPGEEGDDGEGEEGDDEGEGEKEKPAVSRKRTDGPGEHDTGRGAPVGKSGPWTKLSDAPAAVQAEVKRAADKYVPRDAKKEVRDGYISRALESHYNAHQRKKGK